MKTRRTCYDSEGEKRALKKRVEKCSSVGSSVGPKMSKGERGESGTSAPKRSSRSHNSLSPQNSCTSPQAHNSKLESEIEERVRLHVIELEGMDFLTMAHIAFSEHFLTKSIFVALAFLGLVTWEAKRDFILKAYKFQEHKEAHKEEMRMMMSYRRE